MSKLESLKANRKKIAPVILLLVIIAGVLYYNLTRGPSYVGLAEAVTMTNPSEVSGKIMTSDISLGQEVNKGEVIAVIDSTDMEYALEQLELNLEKARIVDSDAKTGQGARAQSGVAAAQAAYNGAAAAAIKADQDYQKAASLYQSNAISESALESAKLMSDTASSALSAAKAQLDLAKNSSAGSVSESSNVDILLLESKIAQQKDAIGKCTILAGESGTVISKNYNAGDFVAPGYDIADIASKSERYLVFYYPKEKTADLQYGAEVSFIYAKTEYTGTIKFIDVKPQYTPQDYQTAANKNRESVKIKILIPENCPMKPGEEAKINL